MINIDIPETRPLSDVEKFIAGLRQLAIICNVSSVSGVGVYFQDGSNGGHEAIWMATGLFGEKND